MGKSFSKYYDINYYDVDWNLNATSSCLINIICDIGIRQSESLGDSIGKLYDKGYAWVFYKYDIDIKRYPKFKDKIKVTTECYGLKKFYAYRKYLLEDDNGNIIAEGKAIFLMINLEKRRLMRIPKEEYQLYGVDGDSEEVLEIESIKDLDSNEFEKHFDVGYYEIDSNFHVNNVNYLEWAINSLPKEIVLNKTINKIIINFLKESKYGDSIKCIANISESGLESKHKITKEDGQILAMVHLYFNNK